jgi:phosphoribosyl-dephospho-CoA transferase
MRVHDLLEIDALCDPPFVVVRRGAITADEIPIGIRGVRRNERWATTCHPKHVKRILTPQSLLARAIPDRPMPALHALRLLKERWPPNWGPGGSVGFELATGAPVVTPDSDLDAVIYAPNPIDITEARNLLEATRNLPAAVDIRVETPHVGFSLAEYVAHPGAKILLKTPQGAVLGTDPWRS